MEENEFIKRLVNAERNKKFSEEKVSFESSQTTSPTQTKGSPLEAFIRNFLANGGEIISGLDELKTWLNSRNLDCGCIDKSLKNFELPEGISAELGFDKSKVDSYNFSISRASFAIAESGAICLKDSSTSDRLATIAPWTHIAVLKESEILPTISDALEQTLDCPYAVWIAGPSKTTDVEGVLVKGVHGPGVQAVLLLK